MLGFSVEFIATMDVAASIISVTDLLEIVGIVAADAFVASVEIVLEVSFGAMSMSGVAYCMAYCTAVAINQGTLEAIAADMAVAAFHNRVGQALLEGAYFHTSSCFAASAVSKGKDYSQLAVRSEVSIDSWSRQEFSLFCQSRVSFSYRVVLSSTTSSLASSSLHLNRVLRHPRASLGSSTS